MAIEENIKLEEELKFKDEEFKIITEIINTFEFSEVIKVMKILDYYDWAKEEGEYSEYLIRKTASNLLYRACNEAYKKGEFIVATGGLEAYAAYNKEEGLFCKLSFIPVYSTSN